MNSGIHPQPVHERPVPPINSEHWINDLPYLRNGETYEVKLTVTDTRAVACGLSTGTEIGDLE